MVDAKTNGVKADVPLPADGEAFVLEAGRPRPLHRLPRRQRGGRHRHGQERGDGPLPRENGGGGRLPRHRPGRGRCHRLYVGCRKGPMVVVMDTETGKGRATRRPGRNRRSALRRQAEADCTLRAARASWSCCGRRTPITSPSSPRSPRRRGPRRASSTPTPAGCTWRCRAEEGKDGPEVRVFQVK